MRFFLLAICFVAVLIVIAITSGADGTGNDRFILPAKVKESKKPSVYLLIFDEFRGSAIMNRKQKINSARFPNFAKLAKDATWYRNYTTASDTTPMAVPAILTGHQPLGRDGFDGTADQSIYRFMRDTHKMTLMDPMSGMCQKPFCQYKPPAKSSRARKLYVSRPSPAAEGHDVVEGSSATLQASQLATMINKINRSKKPQLWVSHTQMPHVPWTYLPNGDQYFNMGFRYPGMQEGGDWVMDEALPRLAEQREQLQLQFLDRLVGQFRRQLIDKGRWDNSLVIITADHGVSNWAGQPRRHLEEYNFADVANPPLFVKYPGQKQGRISDRAVRTVDILPTILEEAGVKTDHQFEGDLLEQAPRNRQLQTNGRRRNGFVYQTVSEMVRQRQVTIDHSFQRLPHPSPMRLAALDAVKRSAISNSLANGMVVGFDNKWQYDNVAFGSGWRPAIFATGFLKGVAPGSEIMITANGKPAGVGSAFVDNDELRFAMILSGLKAKKNVIKAYVRAGGSWLLLPEQDPLTIMNHPPEDPLQD